MSIIPRDWLESIQIGVQRVKLQAPSSNISTISVISHLSKDQYLQRTEVDVFLEVVRFRLQVIETSLHLIIL